MAMNDDLKYAIEVLTHEKNAKCTNVYAPKYAKLANAIATLMRLEGRDELIGLTIPEGFTRQDILERAVETECREGQFLSEDDKGKMSEGRWKVL